MKTEFQRPVHLNWNWSYITIIIKYTLLMFLNKTWSDRIVVTVIANNTIC